MSATLPSSLVFPHSDVFTPFIEARHRYVLLVGGAGSGKSYVTAQKLLTRLLREPKARILVIRKVAATLRRSVFQLFKDLIHQYGLGHLFRISISDKQVEYLPNGAQVLFGGLDDPEKIKSIQGVTSVWVEEATELLEEDFRQLELRLRGETPGYKQIVLTCNPISTQNWVYKRFCAPESRPDDLLVIRSTAFDNAFINPEYLDMLGKTLADDPELFRVYTRGEWGQAQAKDLFYKRFDARQHIKAPKEPDPEKPLHVAFDFNVQPYITCTVWQVLGNMAYQLAEHCLEGPHNTLDDLIDKLVKTYGLTWPAGVSIYGDPAGRARQVGRAGTLYGQLQQGLAGWKPTLRVPTQAPGVALRGQWINRLLAGHWEGLTICISNACTHTLADYAHVREAPDGDKLKTRIRDPQTGYTYEPYGHCSDANDYFLCALWAESYRRFMGKGEKLPMGKVG